MPQPTATDVHVDAILTNISVAYRQDRSAFVFDQVFPIIPVAKESDKYFVYTKADWFRDEAQVRGESAESEGSGYNLTTASYATTNYAFHKDVGDRVRANADNPLQPDRDATEFVTQRLLLRAEVQWAADFMVTSIWGTDKTGTTDFVKWSDYAGSDPFEDIDAGKATVLTNTGYEPNTLVLGYNTWRKLKRHPDFRDQIKHTSAENLTPELLARLLEVDRVLIAKAIKNTAVEGATASYAFVADNDGALLCYVNPSPSPMQPSAGYTFSWTGVSQGLGQDIGISRIRMDLKKADRIEGEINFDNKIVGADLGYMFLDAVD